jgi:hypothetical protein
VLALFWAAVDYGAIHAIRHRSSRMFAAWRVGVRASFGHPLTTLGVYGLAALLVAGLAALLFAVLGSLSGSVPMAIAAAMVVQQLFVVFRVGVRVALVGAEGAVWRVVSVRAPEEHDRPGQHREGEIEQRQEPEQTMERQEMQHDGAAHGHQLRDREAGADADRVHVVRDERVAFADAERHHAEIREGAVEHLGAQEDDDDDVAKPGWRSPGHDN